MTMTERAIKEYTNEYMWTCFYGYILDLDRSNLDDYYAEEMQEKKQRHSYTLSAIARCFSIRSSQKYLPDARERLCWKPRKCIKNGYGYFTKPAQSLNLVS